MLQNSYSFRVLDGGFGTEAARLAHVPVEGHALWGSRLIYDDPKLVFDIHKSFLDAGADIIETGTYQSSVDLFAQEFSLSHGAATELLHKSVSLAQNARNAFLNQLKETSQSSNRPNPLVAGCVGPYGAFLPNRAEYTGNYGDNISEDDLITFHRQRILALVSAGVDFLALDTIPSGLEVRALLRLLREFPNTQASLCLVTTDGQHIPTGESLAKLAEMVAMQDQIIAMGVNCIVPLNLVSPSLREVARGLSSSRGVSTSRVQLMAMPNSGENWSKDQGWFYDDPQHASKFPFASHVSDWIDNGGARWVGGCCRVGPEQVSQIAQIVDRYKVLSGV